MPRHASGVFIDELLGTITAPRTVSSLVGSNCSVAEAAAEAGSKMRQDRLCDSSYSEDENPAVFPAASPWDEFTFGKYRHALHDPDATLLLHMSRSMVS